ncbi:MAG TPA: putative zinc-binding protein [Methanomassiliicoccales archaeon]|nr:putative zinc-binding protein [Methanomassiliicoccales archaeon]
MPDNEECRCSGQELMVFSCSGGCNVGQIANAAAFRLATGGTGKMACLAAVSAGMPGPVTAAMAAKMVLSVDGCPVRCAAKTLEKVGIKATHQVLVTDIGLRKVDDLRFTPEDVDRAVRLCLDILPRN